MLDGDAKVDHLDLPEITSFTPRLHGFGTSRVTHSCVYVPLLLAACKRSDARSAFFRQHVFGASFWDKVVLRLGRLMQAFNIEALRWCLVRKQLYVGADTQEWILGLDKRVRAEVHRESDVDLLTRLEAAVQQQEAAAEITAPVPETV